MEHGYQCWALDVKRCLESIGLANYWQEQDSFNPRLSKFYTKTIKQRLTDIYFSDQLSKAGDLKYGFMFKDLCLSKQLFPTFLKIKSKELARNLARFALMSPGNMIVRHNDAKFCSDCSCFLKTDIFTHRLLECSSLNNKRTKYYWSEWFQHISYELPVKRVPQYLLRNENVECLKFFYPSQS